jgi:glutamate dehydrogenase (NAD(P)+)
MNKVNKMNSEMFDMLGPEKIIEVYNPRVGMRGFVVIDNTALGPGKGGIRMTPTVSKVEVARLARTMTYKNALAQLPFGGAKAGIIADDKQLTKIEKKKIVDEFSKALKMIVPKFYVAAPDMNMAQDEMAWFSKANGSKKACTGKPKNMGGLPHELGSTGYGVAVATEVATKFLGKNLKNMTFAIEGFGNVGVFAAKFLEQKGAKLVAVSDSKGCLFVKEGIDVEKLIKIKNETKSVINYPGNSGACPAIIHANVDILITAAIPDFIKLKNVDEINAKIIIQGSNIPMSQQVEELLHNKGVLIVPDFVANAGGVISSYVEYIGGNEKQMFKLVDGKIRKNTLLVLKTAQKNNTIPRVAAMEIAQKRILAKCNVCKK